MTTPTNAKSTTTKKSAEQAKPSLTREQLETAAKLRAEGSTWSQIREATGTKLSSSAFFRAWEKAEIEHRAAGKPKAKPTKPKAKPARKVTTKAKPTKAKPKKPAKPFPAAPKGG